MRHAVIGAGAWGTALADVLARNGHDVVIWAFEPDVAESINREHVNHRFLAQHPLAPALRATSNVREALAGFPEMAERVPQLPARFERGRIEVEDAPFVAVELATEGTGPDPAITTASDAPGRTAPDRTTPDQTPHRGEES